MLTTILLFLVAILAIITLLLWRLVMDQAALLALIADLSTSVDALIAKTGASPNYQPIADALSPILAKVKAAAAP